MKLAVLLLLVLTDCTKRGERAHDVRSNEAASKRERHFPPNNSSVRTPQKENCLRAAD